MLSKYGQFLYTNLVTHSFPLEKAKEAFSTANSKETEAAVKVVFALGE